MSEMTIPLSHYHDDESYIRVERSDGGGTEVWFTVRTDGDVVNVVATPSAARAIAAALQHYADECER